MKNWLLAAAAVLVLGLAFVAARSFLRGNADEISMSGDTDASTAADRARRALAAPQEQAGAAATEGKETSVLPEGAGSNGATITGRLVVERPNGPAAEGLKVSLVIDGGRKVEGSSDPDGRFTLASLPAFPGAVLTVSGGGMGLLPLHIAACTEGERRDLGELIVSACGSIQGRVVGAGGSAVPEARIELFVNRAFRGFADFDFVEVIHAVYSEDPPAMVTQTDEKGDFLFSGVPVGEYIALASAPGLAQAFSPPIILKQGLAQPRILIRLAPGVVVQGKVVDANGVGIGNAVIAAVASGEEMPTTFRSRKTRSDENGSFRFEGMRRTRHAILARAPGYAEGGSSETDFKEEPITITLQRGGRIEGKVFDAKSGLPLAKVKVYAVNMAGDNAGLVETESNAEGHYVLDGVHPKGRITLLARLDRYALARPTRDREAGFDFLRGLNVTEDDRSGGHFVCDIGMTPCGSVSGRVLRQGGNEPLDSVRIELQATDRFGASANSARPEPVTTGADGRFAFHGIQAGNYLLSAIHPDAVLVVPEVETQPKENEEDEGASFFGRRPSPPGSLKVRMPDQGDVQDLTLLMEDGLTLDGVVVDAVGRPLSGAEVTWARGQMIEFFMGAVPAENPRSVSDEEGRFRLKGLPRSTEILVQGRHHDHPFGQIEKVAPSNVRSPLRLVLRRGGRIEINVLDVDGGPAADVGFQLTESGSRDEKQVVFMEDLIPNMMGRRARSSAEGKLAIEDLPPGDWKLMLDWSERSERRIPGGSVSISCRSEETTNLQLQLSATTTIVGVAVDAADQPMSGVNVRAIREPDENATEFDFGEVPDSTGVDGRFKIEGLTAGVNYVIMASKSVHAGDSEDPEDPDAGARRWKVGYTADQVIVKAGSTGELRIVLKPVEEGK